MASSLLLLVIFALFLAFHPPLSSSKPIFLPLKTQQVPSLPPPKKLFFRHNVSLTISLSVGTPPQPVSLVLDTGSELSWLRCSKSSDSPVFSPNLSSSYSAFPCSSPICKTRTRDLIIPPSCDPNRLCHVSLSYADASSVEGALAGDTFRLGSSAQLGTAFGCMDSGFSSTPQEDAKSTGILGMNRGALSFVSQQSFAKFSYCISGGDSVGVLVLGDSGVAGQLNYTPLVQVQIPLPYFDRVAYSVQLEGIRVAAKVLPLPKSVFEPDHTGAGQTMVDSGTQFTFLLGPVYTVLKNEFLNQTGRVLRVLDEPGFVFQGAMDLCFRIPQASRVPDLPDVVLMFRGAEMRVSGSSLLYRVEGESRGSDGVWCFAFGNSDLVPVEAYIIGHQQQQDMWVEYDLGNSRVGFGRASCNAAAMSLGLTGT
ncbi:hypothetical protein ACLOJK_030031 [Asimina triloba]